MGVLLNILERSFGLFLPIRRSTRIAGLSRHVFVDVDADQLAVCWDPSWFFQVLRFHPPRPVKRFSGDSCLCPPSLFPATCPFSASSDTFDPVLRFDPLCVRPVTAAGRRGRGLAAFDHGAFWAVVKRTSMSWPRYGPPSTSAKCGSHDDESCHLGRRFVPATKILVPIPTQAPRHDR